MEETAELSERLALWSMSRPHHMTGKSLASPYRSLLVFKGVTVVRLESDRFCLSCEVMMNARSPGCRAHARGV